MISFIVLVAYLLVVFIIWFYSLGGEQKVLAAFFQALVLVTFLSIIPSIIGVLIGMIYQRKKIEKEKSQSQAS